MGKKGIILVFAGILIGIFVITVVKAQTAEIIQVCVAQPNSDSQSKNLAGAANTGSVRIVSSQSDCRSGETYTTWNVQGPQGIPGPSGAPGPSGPPGPPGGGSQFVVVDSQNKVMGPLYSNGFLYNAGGGIYVVLDVTSTDYMSRNSHINFLYTSWDCSGTPYLMQFGIVRYSIVVGSRAYYAGDPLQVTPLNTQRTFTPPDSYSPCTGGIGNVNAGPAQSFEVPSFIPPLHISQQ